MERTSNELERAFSADDRWLRELARRLVRDPDLAADLAQQTWLSVFASARDQASQRGFLRVALRNVLSNFRRGDERRRQRESKIAAHVDANAAPEAMELVARVETQRALSAAILALPEPYRETILRRYVEGLEPKAIAARARVPVETVKTRLKRGLELLRAALVTHGDADPQARERLGLGLFALAEGNGITALVWKGLAMATQAKVLTSSAAAIVVAASIWMTVSMRNDVDDARTSADPIVATQTDSRSAAAIGADAAATRTPVDAPSPAIAPVTSAPPVAAPVPMRHVQVRVQDVDGKPQAGVRVRVRKANAEGEKEGLVLDDTGADGLAECDMPQAYNVSVWPESHLWDSFTRSSALAGAEPVIIDLIVARRVDIRGMVVDEEGKPVPNALITRSDSPSLESRSALALRNASIMHRGERSLPDGSFSFDQGALPNSKLYFTAQGFEDRSVPMPAASTNDLRIVMKRLPGAWLRGSVVTADGQTPRWACVALGEAYATVGFDGRFALALEEAGDATLLRAVGYECLPAEVTKPTDGWPPELTLRLGGDALVIRGIVRDARGEARADIRMILADPTQLGPTSSSQMEVERHIGLDFDFNSTAADGSFEMKGLLPREYRIIAFDPRTLLHIETAPVAAGTRDLVITLPSDALVPSVIGKIIARDGTPVEGAMVELRWSRQVLFGSVYVAPPNPVRSDAFGIFGLTDVPAADVRIRVDGDAIAPLELPIEDARASNFTFVVDRCMQFRVNLRAGDPARWFRVLDAAGAPIKMLSGVAPSRGQWDQLGLEKGVSLILAVSERATTIVFYDRHGKTEVRRTPLHLKPGEVTVITD